MADRKDPYRTPTLDERIARAARRGRGGSLGEQFAVELERLNLERLYRDVELPLVDVLVEMEEAGIAVDTVYLRDLGDEFAREVARIEQEAYAAVGHEFGLNSPKQLQSLLSRSSSFLAAGAPARVSRPTRRFSRSFAARIR